MATDVMMQLGDYQFSIDTAAYQQLRRMTAWRWPGQAQLGKRDALQYTGKGEDTITLDGVIYPSFRGGTGQVDSLRALGDSGRPKRLVDGRGNIHGLWVVLSVREGQSIHREAGIPRKQEFTLELKKYDGGPGL